MPAPRLARCLGTSPLCDDEPYEDEPEDADAERDEKKKKKKKRKAAEVDFEAVRIQPHPEEP